MRKKKSSRVLLMIPRTERLLAFWGHFFLCFGQIRPRHSAEVIDELLAKLEDGSVQKYLWSW